MPLHESSENCDNWKNGCCCSSNMFGTGKNKMNDQHEREDFEKWVKINILNLCLEWRNENKLLGYISEYKCYDTRNIFKAWKAGKEKASEEIKNINTEENDRLHNAVLREAEYCLGYAQKYKDIDPSLSDRHLQRHNRLVAVLNGETKPRIEQSEMTEARAREILGRAIESDDSLNFSGHPHDTAWASKFNDIHLEGDFLVEQLKAIVWWMENKNGI